MGGVYIFYTPARVAFHGEKSHDEVCDLMQQSDLFCLPSIRSETGDAEGLGVVFLEAAATGLPVIGTRSGGISETMIEGEIGFLVNERDADALFRQLKETLVLPDLCERMGRASRKLVETKFDLAQQTEALEDLYDEVLGS